MEIRPLDPSHYDKTAVLLADAFIDDPGWVAVGPDGRERRYRVLRSFRSTAFTPWRYVHGGANVMQQATFVRREAFRSVGGFNVENRVSWDIELLVDLGLAGARFLRVNEHWALFRVYSKSISGSGRLAIETRENGARLF